MPTARPPLALIADIGGTNARFALLEIEGEAGPVESHTIKVRDYPGLAEAAEAYFALVSPARRPHAAMVAIAAPPIGDTITMANSGWVFSLADVRERLGLESLTAINDFAAVSWAMLELPADRLLRIGTVPMERRFGRFAAVGSGTGLGVGAVSSDADGRMHVAATEGGHVAFAPLSDEEDALLAALRERFGRVSYERLLSGPGLMNIYQCLGGGERQPEEILARAASAADPTAQRTVEHFCAILGSFAGDVALVHGAWDGVFLSGGILVSLRDSLAASRFRERFEAKGRFAGRLAAVPTLLALDTSLGLRGAAAALRAELADPGP